MSGSTEQPLSTLPVVSVTTNLRVLGFDATGLPFAIDPLAFAEAPTTGPALSDALPLALNATALAGVATTSSRADHRHQLPTATQVGAAAIGHTHVVADVTALQAGLDGKAPVAHGHPISGVTGLQAALDAKAALAHSHAITDVTGLSAQLATYQTLALKGVANGYAPLGADGIVPAVHLPPPAGGGGTSIVNVGTISGQMLVWDNALGRWVARAPVSILLERIVTKERNSATVLSWADYNNVNVVLSGAAPLSLAAAEIGTAPNQGFSCVINNHHTATNSITFGAGITVHQPAGGTGTGGAVIIPPLGLLSVMVYPVGTALHAKCRGDVA
jgi:hypothetical protein